MKILLIGGTGTISMAITRLLAQQGHELYLLNRGGRTAELPDGKGCLCQTERYDFRLCRRVHRICA